MARESSQFYKFKLCMCMSTGYLVADPETETKVEDLNLEEAVEAAVMMESIQ